MVGVTKTTMKKNALPTNFSKAQPTKIVWSHLNPDTYISFFGHLSTHQFIKKLLFCPVRQHLKDVDRVTSVFLCVHLAAKTGCLW